jgi:hypothetical protein
MGTRSFVGVMVGDKCRAVYVHWDGYLEGVGAELQEYRSQQEVEELISYGDRSTLTDGYYQERCETNVEPKEYSTFNELYKICDDNWIEYYYIFKDGVWYCGDTYNSSDISRKLVPYKQALEMCASTEVEVDVEVL